MYKGLYQIANDTVDSNIILLFPRISQLDK